MLNGDATWATHKVVLGWMIDTIAMTIQLHAHRILRLFEILYLIAPTQRLTTVNKWQKLLGELCSMVLTIPGTKKLFSVLQSVLKNKCDQGKRVRLTPPVHAVLQDFRWLTGGLTRRPTYIAELVPRAQTDTFGTQDATAAEGGRAFCTPARRFHFASYVMVTLSSCTSDTLSNVQKPRGRYQQQ
jgi:hypothetical protein